MADRIETLKAVAHPWLCDAMGHLTTRHYAAFFDDAGYQLFGACGYFPASAGSLGWADVAAKIDYAAETRAMELLAITSAITRLGGKSLVHDHEIRSVETGELKARLESTTVRFDLEARKAVPIEDAFRTRASALFGLDADLNRG